mgnify:FL=1
MYMHLIYKQTYMHSVGDLVSLLHTFYTEHSEQKAYSG